MKSSVFAFLLLFLSSTTLKGAESEKDGALKFFENKVRPVLAEHCYSCHGEKKQKSGLRLDNLAYAIEGGEAGPAVVPGDVMASHLIKAVTYEDADLQMPPDGKLDDLQIADLKKWIELGAPWPEKEVKEAVKKGEFTAEDRAWWAFQPLRKAKLPVIQNPAFKVQNSIDAFIFAKLEAEKLTPSPEASRHELVRRVYFDLHGLPPTPEQVHAFVKDERPDAYERLLDDLLADPAYGVRWGQHWLDLVRYAESDGYRQDAYRQNVWPYRDYVIKSMNDDKPYDQFVKEQLAGDELNAQDPEVLIGTAYLRHGIYEYNQRDVETQRTNILNEVTDTTGELFLGLSFGCARCHDHKFDPILQKDYYRLQAFFSPVVWRDDLNLAKPEEIKAHEAQMKVWEEATASLRASYDEVMKPKADAAMKAAVIRFPEEVQAMVNKPESEKTGYEKQISYYVRRQAAEEVAKIKTDKLPEPQKLKIQEVQEQLKAFDSLKPKPLPTAFVASDVGRESPPTVIKTRRGETVVEPGFLTLLEPEELQVKPTAEMHTTGRRTALANWITRPDNPLSTRVMVNRVWQYHFGRGLVGSSSDFGRLGEKPSHPELLDALALEFVKHGWSFKWLHREIMKSATYRQSSKLQAGSKAMTVDPENRWLWRMNPRRLDAEQARDTLLAVSGELKPGMSGPPEEATQPRRALFTRKIRNSQDDFLRSFDASPGFSSVARRESTTTALQSLLLINGDWPLQRAGSLAAKLLKDPNAKPEALVTRAYELLFSRPPESAELKEATAFVKEQEALIKQEKPEVPVVESPLVDAKSFFGTHPLGGTKAVAFKPGTSFEKMRVQAQAESEEFTVEAVIYLDSLYPDAGVRTIVSRWNSDKASKGWSLGVTSAKSRYEPNNLILQLCGDDFQGSVAYEVVASNLRIPLNTPYYVAAQISNHPVEGQKFGGTVTFHTRNLALADAKLETVVVQHPVVGGYVNAERALTLGGLYGNARGSWDGVISRVVLTNGLPAKESLLIGPVQNAPRCLFDAQAETLANTSEPKFIWEKPAIKDKPVTASPARLEALADFCHVLMNSNEFLYLP
jgi:hypothetical protein